MRSADIEPNALLDPPPDFALLIPKLSALAGVRIEGGHADPRMFAVQPCKLARGQTRERRDVLSFDMGDCVAQRQVNAEQDRSHQWRIEVHRVIVCVTFQSRAMRKQLRVTWKRRTGSRDRLFVD